MGLISPEFFDLAARLSTAKVRKATLELAEPKAAPARRRKAPSMATPTSIMAPTSAHTSELEKLAAKTMARLLGLRTTRTLMSPEKKRYIVASRYASAAATGPARMSLRHIFDTAQPSIVRSKHEDGPKVMRLTAVEAALLSETYKGLLVEEDVRHALYRCPFLDGLSPLSLPSSGSRKISIEVVSLDGAVAVAGVRVMLQPKVGASDVYEAAAVTGPDGKTHVNVPPKLRSVERAILVPTTGYWNRAVVDVDVSGPALRLEVRPLGIPAAGGFDWGLRATGAALRGDRRGAGVKVAVIDSGIARHPSLKIAAGVSFIPGESWDDDRIQHGTHCAGVISALAAVAGTWGYAPDVELYAAKVFGGADGGGHASDISDAIDWAVEQGCDVISMSLGADTPSSYMRTRIEAAFDKGVVCVAATGNAGVEGVGYPARFKNVLGVSAIGSREPGIYPADSLHALTESSRKSPDGRFFVADFSNYGDEVDACAPGVAITSTVPASGFAAWDGTSMACPHVAGVAALALSTMANLATLPRDATRAVALVDRVTATCEDLGLGRKFQGVGMPVLSGIFGPPAAPPLGPGPGVPRPPV